jgi:ABC-type Mn2+/Zn2+ transport system permease subunit
MVSEELNLKALFAGAFIVSGLYLLGIYITTKLETVNIVQTDVFIGLVVFIGLSTGHYIGKSLTEKGSALNSFLIGSFITVYVSIIIGTFLLIVNWILGGVMVLISVGLLLMHTSELVEKHENIEKLVRLFAEYLPGLFLPLVSFIYYFVPLVSSIFGLA